MSIPQKLFKEGKLIKFQCQDQKIGRYAQFISWKKIQKLVPHSVSSPLFTLRNGKGFTYAEFNTEFKALIKKSNNRGNSATHSLRRGGTTTLFNSRAPIAYVKDRGQWKSNCIFKYITPSLGDKCALDSKFTLR